MGGNLLELGKNPLADNLHYYWDQGGGFLAGQKRYSPTQLIKLARDIEKKYPCNPEKIIINPEQWARESHKLAVSSAYKINAGETPDNAYQEDVQKISQKQIVLAGCRLAAILNQLDAEIIKTQDKAKLSQY